MVTIQHRQQKIDGFNWTCGSTCLEMIFSFFGISFEENEIWEAVRTRRGNSTKQWFSLTFRLAQYSIEHGLHATIYKAREDKVSEVLDYLNDNNIPVIMNIMEKNSQDGHFVVYTGKQDGNYLISDPITPKSTLKYTCAEIEDLWSKRLNICVTGQIYIAFGNVDKHGNCPRCTRKFPVVHSKLMQNSKGIVCPYCDTLVLS